MPWRRAGSRHRSGKPLQQIYCELKGLLRVNWTVGLCMADERGVVCCLLQLSLLQRYNRGKCGHLCVQVHLQVLCTLSKIWCGFAVLKLDEIKNGRLIVCCCLCWFICLCCTLLKVELNWLSLTDPIDRDQKYSHSSFSLDSSSRLLTVSLCPAVCNSDIINKAGICTSWTSLFLLFIVKEWTNMAAPWEAQNGRTKVFLLYKYWLKKKKMKASKWKYLDVYYIFWPACISALFPL